MWIMCRIEKGRLRIDVLAGLAALGFLLLTALGALSGAETKGPRIQFDSLVHDFGKANEGDILKHTFNFKNAGSEELIIHDVIPS